MLEFMRGTLLSTIKITLPPLKFAPLKSPSLDEGTLRRLLRAKLRRTVIRADRPPSAKIPT
jgi:hypothetical protein